MATLLELQTAIIDISKNHYILDQSDVLLTGRINSAVNEIAGGILLSDGNISPPLPQLFESATVATSTSLSYIALPDNYQRNLFEVFSSTGVLIPPPYGCDYYAFRMFLNGANNLLLNEVGPVQKVCVKGLMLYYQGIPTESVNLGIMYYRKPIPMVEAIDVVDGIPDQFQIRLIKHYVGRQLANEMVDGTDRLVAYHEREFNQTLADMVEFIGIDGASSVMRKKPVGQAISTE